MRHRLATLLALAVSLACAAPAAAYSDGQLRAAIAREMRAAPPRSGAYVRDLDSGAELFALRASSGRIPASVEKLFTTSTALLRMGPTTTLRTSAVAAPDAVLDGDVLKGDLVLVGAGDPFFGDAAAARLARAVAASGIRRVAGAIVGDESAFDGLRSGCCTSFDGDLGGVLSALAYDRGIFRGRAQLDAARFAARRFAAQLKAAGVTAGDASRSGPAPAGARTIAFVPSRSVAELARLINVPSNNFAAEMLLKDIGAQYGGGGTTAAGAATVRATLGALGLHPHVVDGSGLSRADRASPRQVVRLLERMQAGVLAQSFRDSLAVAGLTGTVRARMRTGPAARRCQVKTGTLRLVSALGGYCRTAGGRDVAFALMFNGANVPAAKARENRITEMIARLSAAPAQAQAPPAAAAPDPSAAPVPATGGAAPRP